MAGLVEFAENELNLLLKSCKDSESLKTQKAVNDDILDIIKLFSSQGHSGFSANYSMNILKRLLDYKPLSAIEDREEDWIELYYSPDIAYQNKRCPSIFKDADGKVYNTEAKVFSDDNGHTWYNCKESREYINLPYEVPSKPEYVVIDNQQERKSVMHIIVNTIDVLGGSVKDKDINEETKIADIYNIEDIKELEDKLIQINHISKPLFSLVDDKDLKMWNVINFVMKSDKNDNE